MHFLEQNILNLGIRMPITSCKSGRIFITKITTYEKICSIANSITSLPEHLSMAIHIHEKGGTSSVNLTNPDLIS